VKHEINENEFCYLEDGYMYWFPCSEKGGLSASQLRQISDYLDSRNKEWDDGIKNYFRDSCP
jgi:hypothetical protein